MEREERTDRFTAIEDRFAGYQVYDPNSERIGKVDDLFVDDNDSPEYLGVEMGGYEPVFSIQLERQSRPKLAASIFSVYRI